MKSHLPEYLAELVGTACMLFLGIGAVTLFWATDTPLRGYIPSDDVRRLLTGCLFAGGALLVVLSPLGQRSGGHINPAVTLAFWFQGKITTRDALCYACAQVIGATLGVYALGLVVAEPLKTVQFGLTIPGQGYSPFIACLAEAAITFALVFLILYCVATPALQRRTPYLASALVAFLVFVEAPVSGTSLNPARSFAPALLAWNFADHWIYWVGPPLGAAFAVGLFFVVQSEKKHSGCAKLYHTEKYRCIFKDCSYQTLKPGEALIQEGQVPNEAYVIERGFFEIRKQRADGSSIVLAQLGPGDWVGEMGLILGQPRSADVIATSEAQVRRVTRENFAHVIGEHPEETEKLLCQLAERLHKADSSLVL